MGLQVVEEVFAVVKGLVALPAFVLTLQKSVVSVALVFEEFAQIRENFATSLKRKKKSTLIGVAQG